VRLRAESGAALGILDRVVHAVRELVAGRETGLAVPKADPRPWPGNLIDRGARNASHFDVPRPASQRPGIRSACGSRNPPHGDVPRPAPPPSRHRRVGSGRVARASLRASGSPSSADHSSGPLRALPHETSDGRRAITCEERSVPKRVTHHHANLPPARIHRHGQSSAPTVSRRDRRRTAGRRTADGGRRTAESSTTSSSVNTDPSSEPEANPQIGQESHLWATAGSKIPDAAPLGRQRPGRADHNHGSRAMTTPRGASGRFHTSGTEFVRSRHTASHSRIT
jgi:hypothetical protein